MLFRSEDGNTVTPGLRKGQTAIGNFRLTLKEAAGQSADYPVAAVPADLYYDRLSVEAKTGQKSRPKASLIKNTSVVRFRITEETVDSGKGSRALTNPLPCEISITGGNTMISYENKIAEQAPTYRYLPIETRETIDNTQWEVDYGMMRLVIGNTVPVVIRDLATGLTLVDSNLISLILAYHEKYGSQTDIDREDLFEIDVIITRDPSKGGNDLTVTIKVAGWVVVKIVPNPEFNS